jgi:radical SAM superfamily enzyme YgiQ (UPF0313 family)
MAGEYAKKGSILRTLESGSSASDCLAWLTTLSFENDFPNLVRLLEMARIEPLAENRKEDDPLIVLGGTCPTLNPEPIAPFADVILLGEGNAVLKPFLSRLSEFQGKTSRNEFLASLVDLPFAYVPRFHHRRKTTLRIEREKGIDRAQTFTHIFTRDTEFPEVFLIEAFRGCTARCRFCAAGHLYLPPRERAADFELSDQGQSAIGLVGAGVSGHSDIEKWILRASEFGRVGISSIRHGTLSDSMLKRIVKQGTRSVAIAPEAGTERLRRVCNKPIADNEILHESRRMIEAGFANLKLYFMIGLPTERDKDIEAISDMAIRIRETAMPIWKERGRAGSIDLSVNPFVPKAHTPFQWAPFIAKNRYDRIKKSLRARLNREGNIQLKFESYRAAKLQALFSVGDRSVSDMILAIGQGTPPAKALRDWSGDIEKTIHQGRAIDERLPWDFIDSGFDRAFFPREYSRAMAGKVSPECNIGKCKLCGLCEQHV